MMEEHKTAAHDMADMDKERLIKSLLDSDKLMRKVREHKHNYAEDFGAVVSVPARLLFDEWVKNPEAFTTDEVKSIHTLYAESLEQQGQYNMLGLPIDIQLYRLKERMIPKIKQNAHLLKEILSKGQTEYQSAGFVLRLQRAINKTDELCEHLASIEQLDYGEKQKINITEVMVDTFERKLSESSIRIIRPYGELTRCCACLNEDGFRTYLLGNIIKNLNEHAFEELDTEGITSPLDGIPSLFAWLPYWALKILYPSKKNDFLAAERRITEKIVRIKLEENQQDPSKITIIIENNGKPFVGDVSAVFENEVSVADDGSIIPHVSGKGIGLYSAKQFIEASGGTMEMIVEPNAEYKVGFKIVLPIV